MLSVTKLAPKVFPHDDGKALQARADAVRESDWAGDAVARALDDLLAVVMVSVLVPTIVGTST